MYQEMFAVIISSYIIRNNYFNYTPYCIMRNTLSCIIEMFVVII